MRPFESVAFEVGWILFLSLFAVLQTALDGGESAAEGKEELVLFDMSASKATDKTRAGRKFKTFLRIFCID